MSLFQASKFDADTDSDKPVIGSQFEANEQTWIVMEVGWVTTSALMKDSQKEPTELMMLKGFDNCFAKPHETRFGVQWLIWANKIS